MPHELTIKHITRDIDSAPQAFAFGFAEAFGRALAWAVIIGAFLIWLPDIKDAGRDEPTEQVD